MRGERRARARVLKLAIATLATSASGNILWIYLILHARSRGASEVVVSLITTSSSLMLLTSPLWGHVSDVAGRLRVAACGISLLAASSLVAASSRGALEFISSRLLAGLGLAMFVPAVMAEMSGSGSRRGLSIGIYSASQSAGWALGLTLGGLVARALSTTHAFYLSLALSSIGLATLLTATGGGGRTARTRAPRAVVTKPLALLFASSFFRDGSIIGAYSVLPVFLKELGATDDLVGVVLAVNSLAQIPLMLLVGRLVDSIGEGPVFVCGVLGTSAVIIMYSVAGSPLDLLPVQVLLALSFSSFYVSSRSLASRLVPGSVGAVLGALTLCRHAGGTLMPLLAGLTWAIWGIRGAFVALHLTSLLGLGMALALLATMRGAPAPKSHGEQRGDGRSGYDQLVG